MSQRWLLPRRLLVLLVVAMEVATRKRTESSKAVRKVIVVFDCIGSVVRKGDGGGTAGGSSGLNA